MQKNGKMDLMFGGKGISFVTDKSLEDVKNDAVVEAHNKAVDVYTRALNKNLQDDLAKAEEITKRMEEMEIMPINFYILVKPYAKNPYQKIEVTKSGLIIPEATGKFKNPDSGEDDEMENLSVVAHVIEVSPMCKFIKEGDDVYYRRASGVPVPFFKQGFEVVAEQQIQVVINEKLKERFKNIKG